MKLIRVFYFCVIVLITACLGLQKTEQNEQDKQDGLGEQYGFVVFCGYDSGINDPKLDKYSYYKIYINKAEAGRTTTGLESQKKTFEKKIPVNTHLLSVEKWTLNEKNGEYEKLNNVRQPKPSFFYFEVKRNSSTFINMEVINGEAVITSVSK